jgi:hypothetical protein
MIKDGFDGIYLEIAGNPMIPVTKSMIEGGSIEKRETFSRRGLDSRKASGN